VNGGPGRSPYLGVLSGLPSGEKSLDPRAGRERTAPPCGSTWFPGQPNQAVAIKCGKMIEPSRIGHRSLERCLREALAQSGAVTGRHSARRQQRFRQSAAMWRPDESSRASTIWEARKRAERRDEAFAIITDGSTLTKRGCPQKSLSRPSRQRSQAMGLSRPSD